MSTHFEPFRAPAWLRGPHAQTIWSPLFRRRARLPFARSELETPDGDRLTVHRLEGDPDRPEVLLLHGLEGSVRSHYAVGLAARFHSRGWPSTVMEFRSCDGRLNRTRRLYHSGETGDLDWLVRRLSAARPGQGLYLAGVSLGANVLLKWLGETRDDLPDEVRGAAAISPPFDLTVSGPALDRALGGLYARRFLRTLVPKALAKARQFPGCLDERRIAGARSIETFDTAATAPLHGFADARDYWSRASCGQFLGGISRPTLLVAARDDPFNPGSTHPDDLGPPLVPLFSARGGHVGFVAGWPWRPHHWAEARIAEFFTSLEDGDQSSRSTRRPKAS